MAKRVGVDKWLFFTTLSLVVMGLAMVFSASAVMAQARFGSPYTFLGRQALWAPLGVVAMVLLMPVDYRRYHSQEFIYLAWFLHTRLNTIKDWKHTLLPAVVPALLFLALIVKEPDLGTALVILGMTVLTLLLAGMEWRYVLGIFAAVTPVVVALLIFVP